MLKLSQQVPSLLKEKRKNSWQEAFLQEKVVYSSCHLPRVNGSRFGQWELGKQRIEERIK